MKTLVPSPYDQVAFNIATLLHKEDMTEYELEIELLSLFGISSEIVRDLLSQMEKLKLLCFDKENHWKLTPECLFLLNNSDSRLSTLISSFQFGEIPFTISEEENKEENTLEKDALDILRDEVEKKINEYNISLGSRLKELLLSMNAYRLEEVVIELLVKSGEGKFGFTTPKSNDGGIDGYLFESNLKRGGMPVQTKRYAENIYVTRSEIHEFISVCRSEGVKTGYFVTTSFFSDTAKDVARLELCLVDGEQLIDLIRKTKVGLIKQSDYLYSIDEDYFLRSPLPSGKTFEITA
ncbi:restriction endonuclease [Priestia aryabhattai]|uniref:restriction endonuclease n=1 Tax=Priestia aryabhattai TaxID=412384 RepID=UPI001CFC3C6A|nr:restriction endonuclease [Priestia aryabhattai]